jgi:hypothetical protein
VRHHFGNGLIVGEPSGEATPRVQKLVELLKSTGIDATLSPQIQKDVWFKLWGNMTVNPISALTGCTTDLIMGDDYVRGFISAVMLEAKEIGRRIGIEITQSPEDRHAITMKLGAFKTSMLQDVEAGRSGCTERPRRPAQRTRTQGQAVHRFGPQTANAASAEPCTPFFLLGLSSRHSNARSDFLHINKAICVLERRGRQIDALDLHRTSGGLGAAAHQRPVLVVGLRHGRPGCGRLSAGWRRRSVPCLAGRALGQEPTRSPRRRP